MNYMNHAWGTPPWEDKAQFECSECGVEMYKDTDVCSSLCYEASML
tara:strand:- start:730 stop:867 length:138 start_codon:yes stop_codon:yes gene_type:complete